MTFEFITSHVLLLDSHDWYIIQHIAIWELLSHDETSTNMDTVLGLGQSIFAYICLAYYLKTTPDAAYSLHSKKQIVRPEILHEKAWKTMEAAVIYQNQQDWTSFRTSHQILDTTLELPKLQIQSEIQTVRNIKHNIIKELKQELTHDLDKLSTYHKYCRHIPKNSQISQTQYDQIFTDKLKQASNSQLFESKLH